MKKIGKRVLMLAILGGILTTGCVSKKEFDKYKSQMKKSYMDTDFDGVANMYDRGDSTLADIKVYGDGTPVDTDRDGIPDYLDNDIFTPKNIAVDSLGVPLDSDNDGVPNGIDMEPNSAQGAFVNFKGVTIPTSSNMTSATPSKTNIVNTSNSSSFTSNTKLNPLPVIIFKYSFELEDYAIQYLIQVHNFLNSNPGVKLKVIGHTDDVGSDESNISLGSRRAQTVIDALVSLGVDENRLILESNGEKSPLVDPNNLSLRRLNRRVSFEVQ